MVRAMARPLRIEVAGACYHVTARGNERRAIFRDDRAIFFDGNGMGSHLLILELA